VISFTVRRISDQLEVARLNDELTGLLQEHGLLKVVLNLGNVDYLSSSLLNKLVGIHRRLSEAGGDLKLCQVPPALEEIIRIMHLDEVFDIYAAAPEAIAAFAE